MSFGIYAWVTQTNQKELFSMRKKGKKTKLIITILIISLLVAVAGLVYLVMNTRNLMQVNADQQYEIDSNKQTVYVVCTEDGQGLTKGATLEEDVNVAKQQIVTGLDTNWYITENDLGKTLTVDSEEGVPILKNMVTDLEITQDTRKYEVCVANLMTTQKEDDYVDVRIMFPTGEDFLVLSKKPVKDLNLENCVFTTYLSEEEIVRMASATIDAFTITGTKIYTTKIAEPNLQNPLTPNYIVKAETADLLKSDPNVLSIAQTTLNARARTSLESRLSGLTDEQLSAVSAGHKLTDTAQSSVLLSNQEISDDEITNDAEETVEDANTDESANSAQKDETVSAGQTDEVNSEEETE